MTEPPLSDSSIVDPSLLQGDTTQPNLDDSWLDRPLNSDPVLDGEEADPHVSLQDDGLTLTAAPSNSEQLASDEPKHVRPARSGDDAAALAANLYLTRGFLPDPAERASVLQHIQHRVLSAVVAGDYVQAEKYYNATQRYLDGCRVQDARNVKDDTADNLETQLFAARKQLRLVNECWKGRIRQLRDDFANRLEWAQREFVQSLAAFDEYWADPDHLRPYTKMSGALIQLRRTEKKTVLAKMYPRASIFQRAARTMQDAETKTAQSNVRFDIATKRAALIQKSRVQLERIKIYRDKLVFDMNGKRRIEETGIQIRIANLELQLQRVMQKRPASEFRVRRVSAPAVGTVVGLQSPTTRGGVYNFRRYPVIRKLQLKTYRDFEAVKRERRRSKHMAEEAPKESHILEEEEEEAPEA
jgi:hypothetical protein